MLHPKETKSKAPDRHGEAFGNSNLLDVIDMTEFVKTQREQLSRYGTSQLSTPVERVYVPNHEAIAQRLKLD